MSSKPFHLGWFMNGSSPQGWNIPWGGRAAKEWQSGAFHVDAARTLERGRFDFILWEDAYAVPQKWQGKSDIYVENAVATPRLDTLPLAALVAGATEHIGLIPTLPTFAYHPYLLARQIGTLDSVSGGRAAWNIVTGTTEDAYRNFGFDGLEAHDDRYAKAHEYVDLVKALWDSWGPDSVIGDEVNRVFADPSKVQPVEYQGQYFQHSGSALASGPSPQGRPVLAQAGASAQGVQLAGAHADVVVGIGSNVAEMKTHRDNLRQELVAQGRDPESCKILFMVSPFLGETTEEARARKNARAQSARHRARMELADVSKRTDIDLSVLPMDEPLTPELLDNLGTGGEVTSLRRFVARAEGKTLREMGEAYYVVPPTLEFCGSLDEVASQMEDVMTEVGGDGFLFSEHPGGNTRRYLTEVADGLVPVLQKQGLVREDYSHPHLRDNLMEF